MDHQSKLESLTDFQKEVLEFTARIPRGKVSTYQLVAKAMGRPRAVRAVGNALNKNPLLIKIPCHRVVKSDGQIGGFGAGVKNKIKFLSDEGIEVNSSKKIKDLKNILHTFS